MSTEKQSYEARVATTCQSLASQAEIKRLGAHGNEPGTVRVTSDWLKTVHRDLDACQKVIWLAGCGPRGYGFDPAYCEGAQARLKEIDEHIARAQAQEQP